MPSHSPVVARLIVLVADADDMSRRGMGHCFAVPTPQQRQVLSDVLKIVRRLLPEDGCQTRPPMMEEG